jgi:hypothetical protein
VSEVAVATAKKQWETAILNFSGLIHNGRFCLTVKVKNFIFLGKINRST